VTRDDASARFTVVSMGSFSGQFVYLRSTSGTHGDTSDLLQGGTQVVTTSNEIWYVHDRPSGIEDTDVGFGPGDDRNGHRDLRLRGPDHDVFIDPDARAGGGVWQDGAVLDWTGVRNGQQDGRYALPPHILSARYDRAVDPSIVHLFVTVQTGFHTPSSDRPGGQDGEDDGWTVRRKACHATYPCDGSCSSSSRWPAW